MAIVAGQKAPDFSAKDHTGNAVSLAGLKGSWVVLYFYPKDDTPGCTVEACAFRDDYSVLKQHGAVVLGVSPDSEKSHQKFVAKFSLPFPLLVDEGNTIATAYGAWAEKSMYGRTYMGIVRSTFLISPEGTVAMVWPKVKADGHSQEVLAALTAAKEGKSVEPASAAPAPVKKAAVKSAAVKKAPAPAKKAPAPAKKAAPVKKAVAKKTVAKKAVAKKK